MAHDDNIKRKVRAAYIYDCVELPTAAELNQVPLPTARRWKLDAKKAGDDWDKARAAQLFAGGAVDDVVRQTLTMMIRNVQATMSQIEQDADMPPAAKVQLLATASDAFSKNAAALRRFAPETDALAIRLDVLKKLAEFVHAKFPQHREAFSEILQPFGEVLADG
jgi:uncharacterized membrane protein